MAYCLITKAQGQLYLYLALHMKHCKLIIGMLAGHCSLCTRWKVPSARNVKTKNTNLWRGVDMTDGYYGDINHNYSGSSIAVRALTEAIGRPGAHSGLHNGLSKVKVKLSL
jgi:hypothetical protein